MQVHIRALIGVCVLLALVLVGCAGNQECTGRIQYLPEPGETGGARVDHPQKSLLDIEREKKLAQVMSISPTPMKAPDTILRVLIWPYVDSKGRLYTAHYAFLKVDEGRWILGNYLVKPLEEGERVKFPLHPRKEAGKRK